MTGDCLLHTEHHEMTSECWSTVIEAYVTLKAEGRTSQESREIYKWRYEQDALLRMVRLGF